MSTADPAMLSITFIPTLGLFILTAVAEILGCYLSMLWLHHKGSAWLLLPALVSLSTFVWLLSLHPAASGRVYAAYGAVYIATAIIWLWSVDGDTPRWTDLLGAGLALCGAAIIALGTRA